MADFEFTDDLIIIIDRFENMLNNNTTHYFDVEEFNEIIDFYIDNNKINESLNAVNIALTQHPDSQDILIKKALSLIYSNKAYKSLEILNTISINNIDTNLMNASANLIIGNTEEFNNYINLCIKENQEQTHTFLYKLAISFLNTDKWYNLANTFLLKAYSINESNIFILNDIAISYESLNNYNKAIYYYKKFLDFDPFDETIWYNLGVIYEKSLKFKKAIEAYDFSIGINKKFQAAYISQARAYINIENIKDAINIYKELLIITDTKHEIFCLIGECYEKISDYDNAYLNYTKALKIEDKFAEAWFGLAMVKYETKEFSESLYFAQRAILLDSENDEYLFELGNIYNELKEYKDAVKSYKLAIKLNPFDDEFNYTLADLYFKLDDAKTAIEILLNAEINIKNNAEIKYRLAFYFTFINEINKGANYFEQAIELDKPLLDELLVNFTELQNNNTITELINKHINKNE